MAQEPTRYVSSAERIFGETMALFAERDFHGVSTREIASSAGLNVATVRYHVGGKLDLYHAILRRLHEEDMEVLSGALGGVDAEELARDPTALERVLRGFLDGFVDLMAARSERPGELLGRARRAGTVRADPDLRLFFKSFLWMLYGRFVTGPVDWEGRYGDPRDPTNLEAFKAFMHDYLVQTPGLGGGGWVSAERTKTTPLDRYRTVKPVKMPRTREADEDGATWAA